MSIRRMRQILHERSKLVAYIITAVFIIGLPLVFVPGQLGRSQRRAQAQAPGAQETVALVNGKAVTRADVDRQFEMMVSQMAPIYAAMGQELQLGGLWQMRLDALNQAIDEQLLAQAAKAQGVSASRGEVKKKAQQIAAQQLDSIKSQYKGDKLEETLGQIYSATENRKQGRMSEKRFRSWLVDRMLGQERREIEQSVILDKLRARVVGDKPATEQDLLESFDTVKVRTILVSLHPSGGSERTEEQALKRAQELRAKAVGGADFGALAKKESDGVGASETGGLLEDVRRGMHSAEWDAAVFALKPGEISQPIKVADGYEIVKLETRDRKLPDDFEKNKPQLLENLRRQREAQAWDAYMRSLREKAKIEVTSPEMRAYQLLSQGKRDEAMPLLLEAAAAAGRSEGLGTAVLYYELATAQAEKKQYKEAVDSYEACADALLTEKGEALPGARAEALIGLAQMYEKLGQTEDALLWYQAASDAASSPEAHEQIRQAYKALGDAQLVAREDQWFENYRLEQEQRQRAYEEQQNAAQKQAAPAPAPGEKSAAPEPAPAQKGSKPTSTPPKGR